MIAYGELYRRLLSAHGPQHWWPASDPFEIMIGAVLVQRTAWRNAELAIAALRQRKLLAPSPLVEAAPADLAECIRSAGFFRQKSACLQRLARFVQESGGLQALAARSTGRLRENLLALNGIGAETADTILLYAFERPVAIIDAYLRRLLGRLDPATAGSTDTTLRRQLLDEIRDPLQLNELHALIVAHGKAWCSAAPRCRSCPLRRRCAFGRRLPRSDA